MYPHRSIPAKATLARVALVVVAVVVSGCSPSAAPSTAINPTPGASSGGTAGSRPTSPAVLSIVEPKAGAKIMGSTVHIVLSLEGATIVAATTTNLTPDTGHVHLYVDNVVVSMNYGLEQDLPVHAGTYVIKAEFVAADHAPFNPRVWSANVFFTIP